MSKIKTIVNQFKHMSFKKLAMYINNVHEETGKNRIFLFCDMAWCELRYTIGYLDYQLYGFAQRRGKIRKTYMTEQHNLRLTRQMNDREYYHIVEDKLEFDKLFKDYLRRDFIDLNSATAEDFRKFCEGKDYVFAKPLDQCGGHGIDRLAVAEITDYEKTRETLIANGQSLVEEAIVQHPDMNKLCPDSVNTMRIVTLYTEKGANVVYSLLRMSSGGSFVDNVSSGGLYILIREDGTLGKLATYSDLGVFYDRHPKTSTVFEGYKLPCYEEALELAKEMAEKISDHMKYVGWDICVTQNGPAVIECNILPGYDMCQDAKQCAEGCLPKFEKILGRPI